MTSFSLGVVAHISRKDSIGELANLTQPDVVELDDGTLGCGRNHLATLVSLHRLMDKHCKEWVVVLEDDVKTVPYFRQELLAALEVAPTPIVSLYLGTGYPAQRQHKFAEAVATGASWILHPWLRHGVGYAIRWDHVRPVIKHIEPLMDRQLPWAPDDAISSYALRHAIDVSYLNPSIVEHRDLPSVIRERSHLGKWTQSRNRPRHAHKFGVPLTRDDSYVRV